MREIRKPAATATPTAGPVAIDEILGRIAQAQGLVEVDQERSLVRPDGRERGIGRRVVLAGGGVTGHEARYPGKRMPRLAEFMRLNLVVRLMKILETLLHSSFREDQDRLLQGYRALRLRCFMLMFHRVARVCSPLGRRR